MTTTYYFRENHCNCCGRYDEIEIGTSAAGWVFQLFAYDDGPQSAGAWRQRWRRGEIYDEYGRLVPADEMQEIVFARGAIDWRDKPATWYTGYGTEKRFHDTNGSERGPRGLLRCRPIPEKIWHDGDVDMVAR